MLSISFVCFLIQIKIQIHYAYIAPGSKYIFPNNDSHIADRYVINMKPIYQMQIIGKCRVIKIV